MFKAIDTIHRRPFYFTKQSLRKEVFHIEEPLTAFKKKHKYSKHRSKFSNDVARHAIDLFVFFTEAALAHCCTAYNQSKFCVQIHDFINTIHWLKKTKRKYYDNALSTQLHAMINCITNKLKNGSTSET